MPTDNFCVLSPKLAGESKKPAFDTAFPSDGQYRVVIGRSNTEMSEDARQAHGGLSANRIVHAGQRPGRGTILGHKTDCSRFDEDVEEGHRSAREGTSRVLGPMASDPSIRGLRTRFSTLKRQCG